MVDQTIGFLAAVRLQALVPDDPLPQVVPVVMDNQLLRDRLPVETLNPRSSQRQPSGNVDLVVVENPLLDFGGGFLIKRRAFSSRCL